MQNPRESLHGAQLGTLAKNLLIHDTRDGFVNYSPGLLADTVDKSLHSTDSTNGLVNFASQGEAFLDTLHASLIDSIRGFRLAPIQTKILVCDGVVVGIIAERQRLPVAGNVQFFTLQLVKTGALIPFTKEQVRDSQREAESFVTRCLRESAAACSNKAFLDSILTIDSDSLVETSAGN